MNKILVSVVLAVILILGINKITDTIYYVEKPEKSAYQVAVVSTSNGTTTVEPSSDTSESENIIALFASVSSADGEKVFKKCAACHSIAKKGSNKIGPALWGVLGRKSGFLIKPKDWIKGTKMAFAGLKKAKDRAAVILYMNEKTDSPLPLQ